MFIFWKKSNPKYTAVKYWNKKSSLEIVARLELLSKTVNDLFICKKLIKNKLILRQTINRYRLLIWEIYIFLSELMI